MPTYVPRKGDFIAVTFDPQSGHEQKGRRPALVVSNTLFNQKTGLAIVCPVTKTVRGIPFHVEIGDDCQVSGVVMAEQVRSLDYQSREARRIGTAPEEVVDDVLAILDASLF